MTLSSSHTPSASGTATGWLLLVLTLVIAMVAGQAMAQGRPVGQIDTARGIARPGDAVVLRASGGSVPARSLVRLYDGDRVVVSGETVRLTLFVGGADAPVVVTRASSPYRVRGRSGGSSSSFVGTMMASLDLLFNRPRMAIATATEARGPGDRPSENAFLPAGLQRLPQGERRLVVLWSGPTSAVQVRQGDDMRDWIAAPFASTLIEAPADGDFDIALPGQPLGWSVSRVPEAEIPRAPAAPSAGPLTAEERLANAIWLLAEGDAEWRLYALSEVVELAEADYGAARLLAAIRAGEIESQDLVVTGGS